MFGQSFRHELLAYSEGADGFVRHTLPFVEGALARDEPVLVATGGERIAKLEEALGDRSERVRFEDMRTVGRNPARIIPIWQEFLAERCSSGSSALGVGEPIWPERSPAELIECHHHEALLNLAFDGGRAWHLLCPYDVDRLDDQVIEVARRNHTFISEEGVASDAFESVHTPARPFEGMLPSPPLETRGMTFVGDELSALRRLVSSWATEEELNANRMQELVLAVNELATNSIRYGGGRGELLMWREMDTLLCEIRDQGHIHEPLVGRRRPGPEEISGRGLWLVNQLCDLVQIRSSRGGSTIRVHKHLN